MSPVRACGRCRGKISGPQGVDDFHVGPFTVFKQTFGMIEVQEPSPVAYLGNRPVPLGIVVWAKVLYGVSAAIYRGAGCHPGTRPQPF